MGKDLKELRDLTVPLSDLIVQLTYLTVQLLDLIVQLTECCHAPVDPVGLWLVRRQLNHQHKVGGVAGGGQDTAASSRLVDWAQVVGVFCEPVPPVGFEPNLNALLRNAVDPR